MSRGGESAGSGEMPVPSDRRDTLIGPLPDL
jgi:hypothetical protein